MNKKNKQFIFNLIYTISVLCFIMLVWVLIALKVNNEYMLPKISSVLKATIQLFGEKQFWLSFKATLLRTVTGFLISFFIALLLAIMYIYLKHIQKCITILISIKILFMKFTTKTT